MLHFISDATRSSYFRAFAEHHDRSRFDVTLGTLPSAGALNEDMREQRVPAFALDCRSRRQYPRAIAQLTSWLRRQQTDILQVHLFDASLVGLAAARLARTPVSIFTGHHSHEIVLLPNRLPRAADILCSRWLSTHVIVHSNQMKQDLVRVQRVRGDKIAVIPLGFDLRHFATSPDGRERVRAEFGLQDKIVFGAIGRLFWVKDYPRLFRAFRELAAQEPRAVLLVVGEGPDRPALERLGAELLPNGRLVFAGSRPDVPDCLAAMDVVVHASLSESFGQVLLEAQIAGRPLVTTAVGIAPELISDGVNGFLVPPGDSEGLVRGMMAALRAAERWPQMGEEGRRRTQRFAIATTVAEHERQYLSWLPATKYQTVNP